MDGDQQYGAREAEAALLARLLTVLNRSGRVRHGNLSTNEAGEIMGWNEYAVPRCYFHALLVYPLPHYLQVFSHVGQRLEIACCGAAITPELQQLQAPQRPGAAAGNGAREVAARRGEVLMMD